MSIPLTIPVPSVCEDEKDTNEADSNSKEYYPPILDDTRSNRIKIVNHKGELKGSLIFHMLMILEDTENRRRKSRVLGRIIKSLEGLNYSIEDIKDQFNTMVSNLITKGFIERDSRYLVKTKNWHQTSLLVHLL